MISALPTGGALGAELRGVDLSIDFDDSVLATIIELWHQHEVVFFRGQNLTPEQHIHLSRRIGDLEPHPRSDFCSPGFPELLVVSNIVENGKPIGAGDAGLVWHSDSCCMKEPSRGSLLYARKVPQKDGVVLGDTMFTSVTTAYEALCPDLKDRIRGLRAVNSYSTGYSHPGRAAPLKEDLKNRLPDVEHPIVRIHPYTGKKCLFINEGYTRQIVDVDENESQELLDILKKHVTSPEFTYRHKWQVGDLLIWDNCSTQHRAIADYAPLQRHMERTTVRGTVPIAA